MSAGTCKACAHWGREFAGVCDGQRGDVKETGGDYPLPPRVRANTRADGFAIDASAADDTNLTTHLVTGPDFGCVHFAQRCPVCNGAGHTLDARGYWAGPCAACAGSGKATP